MNNLVVNICAGIVLVSMILTFGVLVYGMIKFKKKYLIVLIITLVAWPFAESAMTRITSAKAEKVLRADGGRIEDKVASASSMRMTGMVSRELIQWLLILSSAIFIFLNEKKANQRFEPIVKTPVDEVEARGTAGQL